MVYQKHIVQSMNEDHLANELEVGYTSKINIIPVWKRCMDIIIAIICLILFLPIIICISVLIKVVSRGPILFKQTRIGLYGKQFTMYKFRTMHLNHDENNHKNHMVALIQNGNLSMNKIDKQSRLILFGNILRSTCLDEIPQFWNVLNGSMSIVGPRPVLPYEFEHFKSHQKKRLHSKPGITGLWQVSGKNRLTFNRMIDLDIYYNQHKSLILDIYIICKTPLVILEQLINQPRYKGDIL